MERTADTVHETERDQPAITTPFEDWEPEKAAAAAEEILGLMEHPGWATLVEAFESQSARLQRDLTNRLHPYESAAEYEAVLGEIRGLQMLYPLVDGIILAGQQADAELKERHGSL